MLKSIHWLGAGLSSAPGLLHLIEQGHNVVVWNRTLDKAEALLTQASAATSSTATAKTLVFSDLKAALKPSDIVVSMLPANMHPEIAQICLQKRTHLVTTSYLSEAMKALNDEATQAGLTFYNEVGLDPGMDHLLTHAAVDALRQSGTADHPDAVVSLRSLCGGFPKDPGAFKYKFSWSPIGVLRALRSGAIYMRDGEKQSPARPWHDLSDVACFGQTYEMYPNRDSLPYVAEYGLDPKWNIGTFVRGTLRLAGWANAWRDLFKTVEDGNEETLAKVSEGLWREHRYNENERDRVVLWVELRVDNKATGAPIWSQTLGYDELGTGAQSAMAKMVSHTAALAILDIQNGQAPAGVLGAPNDVPTLSRWLKNLDGVGLSLRKDEFCAS